MTDSCRLLLSDCPLWRWTYWLKNEVGYTKLTPEITYKKEVVACLMSENRYSKRSRVYGVSLFGICITLSWIRFASVVIKLLFWKLVSWALSGVIKKLSSLRYFVASASFFNSRSLSLASWISLNCSSYFNRFWSFSASFFSSRSRRSLSALCSFSCRSLSLIASRSSRSLSFSASFSLRSCSFWRASAYFAASSYYFYWSFIAWSWAFLFFSCCSCSSFIFYSRSRSYSRWMRWASFKRVSSAARLAFRSASCCLIVIYSIFSRCFASSSWSLWSCLMKF